MPSPRPPRANDNPYVAPRSTSTAVPSARAFRAVEYPYRPSEDLANAYTAIAILAALLWGGKAFLGLKLAFLLDSAAIAPPTAEAAVRIVKFGKLFDGLNYGSLIVFPLLLIAFLPCVYFASRNARALGATDMRFSVSAAILCWFLPVLDLFLPFLMLSEIWQASDPEVGPKPAEGSPRLRAPVRIRVWWMICVITWLVGCALLAASFASAGVHFVEDSLILVRVSFAFHALMALSVILSISVVRGIHFRQEERFANLLDEAAPTSR